MLAPALIEMKINDYAHSPVTEVLTTKHPALCNITVAAWDIGSLPAPFWCKFVSAPSSAETRGGGLAFSLGRRSSKVWVSTTIPGKAVDVEGPTVLWL